SLPRPTRDSPRGRGCRPLRRRTPPRPRRWAVRPVRAPRRTSDLWLSSWAWTSPVSPHSFVLQSVAIELAHRDLGSPLENRLHGLLAILQDAIDRTRFFRGKTSEHVTGEVASRSPASHAQTHPHIAVGPQRLLDGPEPVVTAGATL